MNKFHFAQQVTVFLFEYWHKYIYAVLSQKPHDHSGLVLSGKGGEAGPRFNSFSSLTATERKCWWRFNNRNYVTMEISWRKVSLNKTSMKGLTQLT
jgi:hypothetical protein